MLKGALWLVGIVFGLALAFYGALLFINRHDRPAVATVLQFEALQRSLPVVAAADNGYVYFMGLAGPKDGDPPALGAQRIEWIERQLVAGDSSSVPEFPGTMHAEPIPRKQALGQLTSACKKLNDACIDALAANQEGLAEWLAEDGWRLDRYATLLKFRAWRETLPFDERIPVPRYTDLLDGQTLYLVKAYSLAARGDHKAVRAMLEDDVRFWRRYLASTDSLIGKMIAGAGLRNHFDYGGRVLRTLAPAKTLAAVPALWREPMSAAERSMSRPLMGEWRHSDALMRKLKKSGAVAGNGGGNAMTALGDQLMLRMLQAQESSNRNAENLAALSTSLLVSYPELKAFAAQKRAPKPERSLLSFDAYNMLGSVLMAAAEPQFDTYGFRIADLEGIRRLTLLAIELRGHAVSEAAIAGELGASKLNNPYDGTPFLLDPGGHAIVFIGLDQRKPGCTVVPY